MSETKTTASAQTTARLLLSPRAVTLVASLMGAASAAFMLRHGVHLTPDGWEYWEGSISLLQGRGYAYYGEAPIRFYPPLFSLYLSLVQAVFGESGRGLVAAIVLSAGVVNAVWIHLASKLSAVDASPRGQLILAGFLIQFVAYSYVAVLSETIFLCFLGAGLLSVVNLVEREKAGRSLVPALASLAIFVSAIALTRNAGLVFVPGFALVVACRGDSRVRALGAAAVIALAPLFTWGLLRLLLDQEGSHPVRLPDWGTLQNHLLQLMTGVPELFGPSRAAIGAGITLCVFGALASLVGAAFRKDTAIPRAAMRDVVIVTATGLAGLVALMSSVTVGDPLSGRFVWFVPMTTMVLLCAGQSWLADARHAIALSGVMMAALIAQPHRIDALPYRFPTRVQAHQTMSIDAAQAAGSDLEHILPPQYPWIVKRRGFALEHRAR